jgi:hypothetical protein
MKILSIPVSLLICISLMVQGCSSLGDDSFAINVKRNGTEAALRSIQPHSGKLRVTERNGRTYYPIEYALINGNRRLTYALIDHNSPTRLYGKSLAYNAAVVGNTSLANDLAGNGYGTRGDVERGIAQNRANAARRRQSSEMAGAIGILVLAALLGGGGGGGGGYDSDHESARISAIGESLGQNPAAPTF